MAEEKKQRSIYEKMTAIKMNLIGIKKSGKNEFSNYTYFELGDILPILTPALQEEGLYMKMQFSMTEQTAKLIITDMDNPDSILEFEIRVGSCTLKAAHDVQNLGAAITYTRRYLIMLAFDIAESDIIDGGAEREEKRLEQNRRTQQQQPPKSQQRPPAKPAASPDKLAPIKREAWELIKKLPSEEDRTKWVNKCGEADEETLKNIINKLYEIITPQPPKQDNPETENFKKMLTEAFSLIERLPEAARNKWIEAAQEANETELESLLAQIQEKVNLYETTHRPQQTPAAETTTPQEKPANQPENQELEIF